MTGADVVDGDTARAVDLAGRVQRLEAELAGLRRGMRTRGVIEQAKGRLIERHGLDEDEAFRQLVQQSQCTGRRVAEVAADLVADAAPRSGSESVSWRRHIATLRDSDSIVGAVEVVWPDGPEDLAELARRINDWLAGRPAAEDAERHVAAVLDALGTPAIAMTPMRAAADQLTGFVIDQANGAAAARFPVGSAVGLAELGERLFDACAAVADVAAGVTDAGTAAAAGTADMGPATADAGLDGVAGDGWSVVPVGSQLVVIWSFGLVGDAEIERLAGFGWAEWSADLQPVAWSPGLYRLLDRDPADGPAALAPALAAMPADQADTVGQVIRDVAAGRSEGVTRATVRRADGVLDLRVVATSGRSRGAAVLALFQDVTGTRRQQDELARASAQLASHRMGSAAERTVVQRLRSGLLPSTETRLRHHPLTVVARHVAPTNLTQFRGDFYEALAVDGDLFVIVGDVFGGGIPAAEAMIRLRHTARGLALAGYDPADMMRLLNRELCSDAEPPLASLIVARFAGPETTMRWAQAGHYSPIRVHQGRGRSLRRPAGHALGLRRGSTYGQAQAALPPGDLVVFYTDGVLHGREDSGNPVAVLSAEIAEHAADPIDVARHFTRPTEDEACLVAVAHPARPGP